MCVSGGVRENMFRKADGGIDMVSLILTVVIAAVTMMVGLVVVANMEASMPSITESVLSTSLDSVLTNTGTAFTDSSPIISPINNDAQGEKGSVGRITSSHSVCSFSQQYSLSVLLPEFLERESNFVTPFFGTAI